MGGGKEKWGEREGERKLRDATQQSVHSTLIRDFMHALRWSVVTLASFPPSWVLMQGRNWETLTPGSSFLYGSDSRLPVRRTDVETGKQKWSPPMCGQMWDSWWLSGLRTTNFTAVDCNHWWEISRDFPEQLPHKPLRTTTSVCQGEVSSAPPCLSGGSFPELPQWLSLPIHSSLPIICGKPTSHIKLMVPGISKSSFVFVPKPRLLHSFKGQCICGPHLKIGRFLFEVLAAIFPLKNQKVRKNSTSIHSCLKTFVQSWGVAPPFKKDMILHFTTQPRLCICAPAPLNNITVV